MHVAHLRLHFFSKLLALGFPSPITCGRQAWQLLLLQLRSCLVMGKKDGCVGQWLDESTSFEHVV